MNKNEYWKNFSLGTELETSGTFIYNGLKQINDLTYYEYSEDVFEVLYNLSVGIERLMKIVIVLTEHQDYSNQEALEKSLITHNLDCLRNRIEINHNLELNDIQKEFLVLLTTFYIKHRYDRYNINESNSYTKDKDSFIQFLCKKLNIKTNNDSPFNTFKNTKQIKSFLVKIVSKITIKLYEVIEIKARGLNIYTYDLRPNGKAYKVFIYKDFNFELHTILKKEFVIALINNKNSNFIKFIKSIKPMPFDVQDENEIISLLLTDNNLEDYFDALETYYEELENKKERFDTLNLIDKIGVEF
ncbi:hypothetical protein U1E44_14635 [Arenibacter sp. GZD96]|uniref:hypothetical protein n=1 Tax=Aurantibrevibacter litoralis TaxID=3106030 RepID=UPI002AFEAE0E|nr:hypothetical protein [Arenibacter sp. GZD-96]MEA1787335.1 hypothetical protein [Arenibacter sp. GZD-96]